MRPLSEQVVVVTGASSGAGRATALAFGRAGAAVVLAARDEAALREAAAEVERTGGRALAVPTDVAEWPQVQALAQAAEERFGRIDTWVNNAAIGLYATVAQSEVEEIERVIQVDLLGQIYGAKAALPVMQRQGQGTLIFVASVVAERAVPLQGAYTAAKHGVKGFADSLRVELEHDYPGIAVTVVLPAGLNTPFFRHARSKVGTKPRPIPPAYAPEAVAEAIVSSAQHRRREVVVGGAGAVFIALNRLSPTLTDRLLAWRGAGYRMQETGEPDNAADNFYRPLPGSNATSGEFGNISLPVSLYTQYLDLQPNLKRLLLVGLAGMGLYALRHLGRQRS